MGLIPIYICSIWLISALLAILFHAAASFSYQRIAYLPYVYMHLCFLLSFLPIIKIEKMNRSRFEMKNDKIIVSIMYFFVIVSIVPFIENLNYFLTSYGGDSTVDLAEVYNDKMYGEGVKITWLSSIGKIGNSIDGIFYKFLVFAPFYLLSYGKIKKTFLLLMFLPVMNHLIFQLCSSGRGTVVNFILMSLFLFLFFRKQIPIQLKRSIIRYGGIVFVCIGIALSILTIARKDASNRDALTSVVVGYYVAKSHLDFNEDMWHIKKHTEGDNSFPFAKRILGMHTPENKNDYWHYGKIGIEPYLFYTYIGDWFMDFGAIITLSLFFMIYIIARCFFITNKKNSLLKLFMVYVYCDVLIMGWSINTYKTEGAMRNLIFNIILILIIQYLSQLRYKKTRLHNLLPSIKDD